jgi:hypothetical protein
MGYYNSDSTSTVVCGGKLGSRKASGASTTSNGVRLHVAVDEALGQVTVTVTGPDGVWFGVGFNASQMSDLPYAIVVDGSGKVSEHKLADQQAGVVLKPTVTVLSSGGAGGVRSVTLTRPLTIADNDDQANYYGRRFLPFLSPLWVQCYCQPCLSAPFAAHCLTSSAAMCAPSLL